MAKNSMYKETLWIIWLAGPDNSRGMPVVVAASTAKQAIMKAEKELEFRYPLPVHSIRILSNYGYLVTDKEKPLHFRDVCGGDLGRL